MPYHKSCEKRMRSSKKRNIRNRMARSRMKTSISGVVNLTDKSTAATALSNAFSVIDKSVKTGILHKKNAAHKKARLAKLVLTMKS